MASVWWLCFRTSSLQPADDAVPPFLFLLVLLADPVGLLLVRRLDNRLIDPGRELRHRPAELLVIAALQVIPGLLFVQVELTLASPITK